MEIKESLRSTIEEIISIGHENENVDFKANLYNREAREDFLKDIMAMANTHNSGDKFIICGIKLRTNGEIDLIGIEDKDFRDEAEFRQLVNDNIEPEIAFEYFNLQFKDTKIAVFRIFDNTDRPYMMKKDQNKLKQGHCYIRKGSSQRLATRKDYDRMYREIPISKSIKVSSSAIRRCHLNNDIITSTITDDNFIFNISDKMLNNVSISVFLDVLILEQIDISIGSIPPKGAINLSKLDKAFLHWRNRIAEVENVRYSNLISHVLKMMITYTDENGIRSYRAFEIGIQWSVSENVATLEIGFDSSCKEFGGVIAFEKYDNSLEIYKNKKMLMDWRYIKSEDYLSKDDVRELAWTIYQKGYENAHIAVESLFAFVESMHEILQAKQMLVSTNEVSKEDRGFIESAYDLLYLRQYSDLKDFRKVFLQKAREKGIMLE